MDTRLVIWGLATVLAGCHPVRETVVVLEGTAQLTRPGYQAEVPAGTSATLTDQRTATAPLDPERVARQFGALQQVAPPAAQQFTLYVETGTTALTPESTALVREIVQLVASRAAADVEIVGHTDTVGALEKNDQLALQRAEAVRGLLEQAGLQAQWLRIVGRGERQLLVPTADDVAEARNRRVDVLVR